METATTPDVQNVPNLPTVQNVQIVQDVQKVRQERGLAIAAQTRIVRRNGFWIVPSSTGNGHYRVILKPPSPVVPLCNCPDFEARGQKCKHVYAVEYVIKRETSPDGSHTITETITTVQSKRKTYKQDWPAYDKAQVEEKARFLILLKDLVRGIVEPPHEGPGRRPVPLADAVFLATYKVYSTLSTRRFMTDATTAADQGLIARPYSFSAVAKVMESPDLTPLLQALIAASAAPLKSIESDFAVDSSGFTGSRFVRWFDQKYGIHKNEHKWIKSHIMTGVKTNIITAAEIGPEHSADCPQFTPLVCKTGQTFAMKEISADKAYLSYDNAELAAAYGATPYIQIKIGTTAARGGIFSKMFHMFNMNREDYLDHYHKRSNIESTFSMVKAKFGDGLRSKTDTAMANEALCKILAHNICCIIQSVCELGLNPVFWEDESPEPKPESAKASIAAEKLATIPTDDLDTLMGIYEWM